MPSSRTSLASLVVLTLVALVLPAVAAAHGFAGKRFFPATLTFDDPFTMDEFGIQYGGLPDAVSDEGDRVDIHTLSLEYGKSITPDTALSIGTAHRRFSFADGDSQHGFDNIEVGVKIMGNVDAQRESAWAYGIDVDLGGTSGHGIGESFTTYSPGFFFGKAFGNLADQGSFLRPFAVTGQIALNLPEGDNARSLTTAFSLQYSLNYLEAFVKNVGLPHPLHNALLLVEMPLDTCLDHGCDGDVTGTVNPGIMFFNGQGQLTAEAVLPVNDRTGDSVGFLLQVHLYLDDLFPHSLGRPIFHRGMP